MSRKKIGMIGLGIMAAIYVDKITAGAIILAGLGLLRAKDGDVTGGSRLQETPKAICDQQCPPAKGA